MLDNVVLSNIIFRYLQDASFC